MPLLKHDIELPETHSDLLIDKHAEYLLSYGNDKDEYTYCMTEHLRMSGLYWGLTALDMMSKMSTDKRDELLTFIKSCQHKCGGISASINHDPHILYTLSAVQILSMVDALAEIDQEAIVTYIKQRMNEDGSFTGDIWGEVDTRFTFCAVATLALLGKLDRLDTELVTNHVLKCINFDGGFGSKPGSESHAGMIYCCLGTLSVLGELDRIQESADKLAWWLCERQLPSGGLNGRPEKLPDLCYSWWVLSSLTIIGKPHWIDKDKLVRFVLACQDTESGGFSDRPGNIADPFHTLFGLTALTLLETDYPLKRINPTFCMPQYVIDRLGLRPQRL